MATYYRWTQSQFTYTETIVQDTSYYSESVSAGATLSVEISDFGTLNPQTGLYKPSSNVQTRTIRAGYDDVGGWNGDSIFVNGDYSKELEGFGPGGNIKIGYTGSSFYLDPFSGGSVIVRKGVPSAGTFVGYVYSTNASAYPTNGVSGSYYYSNRTTITSPTAPSGLTYPAIISTPAVAVSWSASVSNVPSYSVSQYEISYSTNGGSTWTGTTTTTGTSTSVTVPAGVTSLQIRIRAQDTNGQWSSYTTGGNSSVLLAPTLTVPSQAMQGQDITVNWTAITGATSYTLQRKADTDDGWQQVYSGDALTFTETVGTWTSVQYQVQAVFSGGTGGWATSGSIPVISASALVISGADGNLGTLTADVPYTISSDTGNDITLTRTVNGVLVASLTVQSGFAYNIPVMDLPTGTGTIVITASVQATSGPVSASRTWTYTKVPVSFPNTGSTAQLTQQGQNVFPSTLAECVRVGKLWNGSLDKALEMLGNAATYTATAQPKYSEVTVDLSTAQSGQIINLPYNGVMLPHIVVQVGNPDTEMYDESCNGVWLLQQDIVEKGQWNSSNSPVLAGSTIMTTMQGYAENYDPAVQAAIQTAKIPYCVLNDTTPTVMTLSNGYECKIFPLSAYETGFPEQEPGSGYEYPVDGVKLSYFLEGDNSEANNKRIAFFNNTATIWYFRSFAIEQNLLTNSKILCTLPGGNSAAADATTSNGYRPCFILPTTFTTTYYVDQEGGIHAEQEYTVSGGFADLWGNHIPVPKIETGSYTGTGTYGQSSPNTLTFSFEPKTLHIYAIQNPDGSCYSCEAIFSPQLNPTQNDPYLFQTAISSGNYGIRSVVWAENTVSWYAGSDANNQLNRQSYIYFYYAIG